MVRRVRAALAILSLALAVSLTAGCSDDEPETEPQPTPEHFTFSEQQLSRIPLRSADLPPGGPEMIEDFAGSVTNAEIAEGTWAIDDTAETWEALKRIGGHVVDLTAGDGSLVFVTSSVDLYADESLAREGFLRQTRDFWESDAQEAEGFVNLEQQEKVLAGIGDQALSQSVRMERDGSVGFITGVVFRRVNLVGFVGVMTFDRAEQPFDAEALARVLDDRITAAADDSGESSSASASPGTAVPSRSGLPAAEVPNCDGSGARVCLVPLTGFADPPIASLVEHLLTLGIPAGSVAAVDIEVADINPARNQLSANRAAERVAAAYPALAADDEVTLIAFTDRDIFIEGATYDWVFGLRGPESLVISTARMDERLWDRPQDDAMRDTRLRKMLLRYVGLFHLGLPENDMPLTVLYRHLDGLTQLDAMREGILEPSDLPIPASDVDAWARDFCTSVELLDATIYDSNAVFQRSLSPDVTVADMTVLVLTFLDELRAAQQAYDRQLAEQDLPERADELGLTVFYDALAAQSEVSLIELDNLEAEVRAATTYAAISGELFEYSFLLLGGAELAVLVDAYQSLSLEVLVSLSEAGPCGGYTPANALSTIV